MPFWQTQTQIQPLIRTMPRQPQHFWQHFYCQSQAIWHKLLTVGIVATMPCGTVKQFARHIGMQTIDMGPLGSYQNTTVTKKEKAWMYNESGKPKSFDNPLYDLTFINPSQAVIDKYQLVDTGEDEEVAGRMCRKFNYQTTVGKRNKVVYQTSWVYKGVVLKNVMITARQETVTEVTEFQENAEIPAGTFEIPE